MPRKPTKKTNPLTRYTAKLLWQFRVSKGAQSKKKRCCEERVVMFEASGGEEAYKKLLNYGKRQQFWWWLDKEGKVKCSFEFVGILDFDRAWFFDDDEEFHEIWHDLKDMVTPLERKKQIIPPKKALREFDKWSRERSRGRGVVKLKW